jgi:LuxR family maltose regulon positive regulatory protein
MSRASHARRYDRTARRPGNDPRTLTPGRDPTHRILSFSGASRHHPQRVRSRGIAKADDGNRVRDEMDNVAAGGAAAVRGIFRAPQFPLTKFGPPALPDTLVARPGLRDRLTAGADRRLTVVVGSAGAGKTVLLADWLAARPPGDTSWLSCDGADGDLVRFWAGFIEAVHAIDPDFGADAVELLTMDGRMSADVVASLANDAARLPEGSAVIVDDFHFAAPAVTRDMTDLVECWAAKNVQLVLASRFDPPLRLHRMRLAGELCEIRDRDMYFSLADTRHLLANFGVQLPDADVALLHRRSEGWPAALQMATLSLRSAADPARAAHALELRSHEIADYFVTEVLDQQSPELARFMLDSSVLGELTADACAAVTARQDAATLLRRIDAAHLFLVALDEGRSSFRYHHLVSQALRAELRARDPARERLLQLRSAEWFESAGEPRSAARHFLAGHQPGRALALLRDHGLTGFLQDPADPAPLDLSTISPSLLVDAPDDLLALATDLLLSGDIGHGGQCLDLFERGRPAVPFEPRLTSRFAVMRAFHHAATGQLDQALGAALRARVIQRQHELSDEFNAAVPLILLRVYPCLEDLAAVEREATAALALPGIPEAARLVLVPGARALAMAEAGHLADAAGTAAAAAADARGLGFDRHYFAVDHLRALACLALERHDLDTAEQFTEQVLRIAERRWPLLEYLALLDRARIWAARGEVREALATVESARPVLSCASSMLQARADEQEAVLRLSLGDLRTPADLGSGLVPHGRRCLLLAKVAIAAGDQQAAQEQLRATTADALTPRRDLERELLLAAAAIARGDPATAGIIGTALHTARRHRFRGTVVTTSPLVTEYLVEHAVQLRMDPFIEELIAAALEVRAAQAATPGSTRMIAEPLTTAEQRVLQLLPTSTYAQIANSLCISRNTVKTHIRSIYQKLGVTSRSEAVERAVDVHLL